MKGFIISTTNNIEGRPIKKYIDAICVNVVVGTNIFSDFAASLTDFFGGRSGSYKRKLELIYNEASKELKDKALNLGANAIVGFNVDFDEISGKDKSMFMVSVSGTACIIEEATSEQNQEVSRTQMSFFELEKEEMRRRIISGMNEASPLHPNWAEFLMEHPQKDIIENLVVRYIELDESLRETEFANIEKVISSAPIDWVVPIVYSYHKQPKVRYLIERLNLFSPQLAYEIITKDVNDGLNLLSASKSYYDKNDLKWMKKIVEYFDNLPNNGRIEVVKSGVFSKDGSERFICVNGHKNNPNVLYCERCGLNMKGLTKEAVYSLKVLKERSEIVEAYIQG